MKKFISKPFLISISIFFIILICLFLTVAARAFLMANKERIELELTRKLNHKTTIESIYYFPPNFLVLNDVSLAKEKNNKNYSSFSVRKIAFVFSLKQLINEKNLVIKRINFIKPEIDAHKHPLLLKDRLQRIIAIINMLAQGGSLAVSLDDAAIIFERKANLGRMTLLNAKLVIDSDKIIKSRGKIAIYKFKEPGKGKKVINKNFAPFVFYAFDGLLKPEGIDIRNIELESGNFQAAFKGGLNKNVLNLAGRSTLKSFYQPSAPSHLGQENRLTGLIKNVIRYGKLPQKIGVSFAGLNILDIECSIMFEHKKIIVKKLNFNCNNIPIRFKGEISFPDEVVARFDLMTYPEQDKALRKKNPKRLDLSLQFKTQTEKLKGIFYIDFLKKHGKEKITQTIKAFFNGFSFGILPDQRIKLFSEKLKIQYGIDENIFEFLLNDYNSIVNFGSKNTKAIKFQSEFFDGSLTGYAWCDLSVKPFHMASSLQVANVSTHELDALLFSLFGEYRNLPTKLQGRVDGKFACNLDYTNYPLPHLTGQTIIKNGYLDNVTFFIWLADSFGLPSLKKIDFSEFSLQFESTDRSSILKNMRLVAKDLLLEGDFQLEDNEFVTSKISVTLPRELLKQSPKFNLLLALIDKQAKYFNFDFQLSGLYKSLNFKWLDSEFKIKIRRMLPGFIKRGLERKIEKAIKLISS